MLYLDSSAAVALLVTEPHSERVDAWLAHRRDKEIALSRWVETEVAAALSAKLRIRQIDARLLDEARTRFIQLARSSRRLPIGARQFALATQYAAAAQTRLRGGDALHMAISFEAGAVLCTLDRRQAEAASVLDIQHELI